MGRKKRIGREREDHHPSGGRYYHKSSILTSDLPIKLEQKGGTEREEDQNVNRAPFSALIFIYSISMFNRL